MSLLEKWKQIYCQQHNIPIGFVSIDTTTPFCQFCQFPKNWIQLVQLSEMLENFAKNQRDLIQKGLVEIDKKIKDKVSNINSTLSDAKFRALIEKMDGMSSLLGKHQGSVRSLKIKEILIEVFKRIKPDLRQAVAESNIMTILGVMLREHQEWQSRNLNRHLKQLKSIENKIKSHQHEVSEIQKQIDCLEFFNQTEISNFISGLKPFLKKQADNNWTLTANNEIMDFYSRKIKILSIVTTEIVDVTFSPSCVGQFLYRIDRVCFGAPQIENLPGHRIASKQLQKFELKAQPNSIKISKDTNHIAIVHRPYLSIINVQQNKISTLEKNQLQSLQSFCFTPNCRFLVYQVHHSLKYFDLAKGKVTEEYKGFSCSSQMMEISENNKYIALIDHEQLDLFRDRSHYYHWSQPIEKPTMVAAQMSPDSTKLVVALKNSEILIFGLSEREKIYSFHVFKELSPIKSIQFSQSSKYIAIAGPGKLFIFDTQRFQNANDAISAMPLSWENGGLSFSSKEDMITYSGGRSLRIFEAFGQKQQLINFQYSINKNPTDKKKFVFSPTKPNVLIGIESDKKQVYLIELELIKEIQK